MIIIFSHGNFVSAHVVAHLYVHCCSRGVFAPLVHPCSPALFSVMAWKRWWDPDDRAAFGHGNKSWSEGARGSGGGSGPGKGSGSGSRSFGQGKKTNCGSVVIALGKVLVIGSLGILTLRPLAKVVILALQSLQRRRRKRKNNEQLTLGKIRRTRGQVISKGKEFRPLAMVRRTQPGAENAAGDAARKGTQMINRTNTLNGWNENCQRPVKSPQNGTSKRGRWLTRIKPKQHGYILPRRKPWQS